MNEAKEHHGLTIKRILMDHVTIEQILDYANKIGDKSITDQNIRSAIRKGHIPGARKIECNWVIPVKDFYYYLENRIRLERPATTTKDRVLKEYNILKSSSGFAYRRISRNFKVNLSTNPSVVYDIAFDSSIDENDRRDILLLWSKDHRGSCSIRDNPRWTRMMRTYIIPRMIDLPEDIQSEIEWYQEVHGL